MTCPRDRAIALVSGGMDSCVTAALARQGHDCAFLHADYGQRTEGRERAAFEAIADHYGVTERLVADLGYLRAIGGSSLTDPGRAVERGEIGRREIPSTYVPFRNAHILAIAVSWGEVLGARRIFIGAVEEDSSGYPDCRAVFYEAFNRAIALGTRPETLLEVVAPLIGMTKREIALLGAELEAPFHLTWSCYIAEDLACGECDSCLLRLKGFREAGIPDPLPYRSTR